MTSVLIYNNLSSLIYTLSNNYILNNTNINDYWLKERVIIYKRNYINDSYISLKIWKTLTYNNNYFQDMNINNYIGSLDYMKNYDNIKIEYISINDIEKFKIHNGSKGLYKQYDYVNDYDSKKLFKAFINHIVNIAKYYNISKIYKDVHYNLKVFKEKYEPIGFKLTSERSEGNPYWIIATK